MRIVSIASSKRMTEEELRYPSDVTPTYAVRLDDALREEGRIDVLKCDIDGHDYRAMRGGLEPPWRARGRSSSPSSTPARFAPSARSSPSNIFACSPASTTG